MSMYPQTKLEWAAVALGFVIGTGLVYLFWGQAAAVAACLGSTLVMFLWQWDRDR
jgi:hypothetical protein